MRGLTTNQPRRGWRLANPARTALRDVNDLLARGVLGRLDSGGRCRGIIFAQIGLWPLWNMSKQLSNLNQLHAVLMPTLAVAFTSIKHSEGTRRPLNH
jgi:hypothetical protein